MSDKCFCIIVTVIAIGAVCISFLSEVIKYNNYFKIENVVKYDDLDMLIENKAYMINE